MSRKTEKFITFAAIIYLVIGLPMVLWAQGSEVAPVPDSVQVFVSELITSVLTSTSLGGWAALVSIVGSLVMFSVRAVKLFKPLWWDKLSPLGKFALPFLAAALGAAVVGVAGALAAKIALGTVVAKLVGSAIAAGFAAVTMNEGTKQIGMTFDMMAVKNIPGYEPGSLRKKMSLVVGIPDMDKVRDKVASVK